jgi:predicted MPP superfamily phosphohydrolase
VLGFSTVVLLAMAVLHGYLWFRLVRSTTRPGPWRRRLTLGLVGLGLLVVVAVPLGSELSLDTAALLEWPAFIWLAVAFYLFVTLLALEPVRLVARLALRRQQAAVPVPAGAGPGGHPSGEPAEEPARAAEPPDASRRLFLARGLAVTAGVVAVGTVGTGAVLAADPVVRRVPVTLSRLDPALDGLRIVTFSDAHLSAMFRRRRVEELVELVNEQRPDVVAIVGDLVDAPVEELREDVAPLMDLVSAQGVFFVTGNHEYFTDTDGWMRHLPTLGMEVLRNERVALRRGGASLDLAGIDDRIAAGSGVPGHGADLDAALDGRDDATPVVLLAHQPVMVEQAREAGVDLQLSGHTHGGQLWPFDYAVRLDQPAVQGLSRVGDTQLYVTTGAGSWGPPVRVGARPEVAVVELRAPRG